MLVLQFLLFLSKQFLLCYLIPYPMSLIDPEILCFYTSASEDTRLISGLGPLEFERNKELILRYLPPFPAAIADVGGGPGHYARWLADLDHSVVLLDPVPKHIQQAKQKSIRAKKRFECVEAEARSLPLTSHSMDVVILHGPLYHLQEWEDRRRVFQEARRVLKKNGILLCFAITHASSTLAMLMQGLLHHDGLYNMCLQELRYGDHFPPQDIPGLLTEAYFHRPSHLLQECSQTGFRPLALLPVEGMVWLDQKFFSNWAHPIHRKRLLELIRHTEADAELLCFSPHIMLAAERLEA